MLSPPRDCIDTRQIQNPEKYTDDDDANNDDETINRLLARNWTKCVRVQCILTVVFI